MIEIKDLLIKWRNILLSEDEKKNIVSSILYDILKIKIGKEKIEIKNGVLYLNIKPIYKNEIFLKKETIQEKMKEALGKKAPEKIL